MNKSAQKTPVNAWSKGCSVMIQPKCFHTFMFYTRNREIFSSLPENFPRLCIPQVHPVSTDWLRKQNIKKLDIY